MARPQARGLVTWTGDDLAAALRERPRVVALTGAGLSVASGLMTRKQLWQRFARDEAVSAVRFRAEPQMLWSVIRAFWGADEHAPNAGHLSLATLPGVQAIVTQNVDDLHQRAAAGTGTATPVVELHGSLSRTRCVGCGRAGEATAQVLALGEPLPPGCPGCGAVIRPEVVLFGEPVPADAWAAARRWVEQAELLLVVGCAMDVSPASELPLLAAQAGARIVEIKRRPSRLASVTRVHHVAGAAEEVLPRLVQGVRGGASDG
jgi:NAD-dependent deacetylase